MNSWELQEEKIIADIFKRPMRWYIKDKPFYPYVKTDESKTVNFDLNFRD